MVLRCQYSDTLKSNLISTSHMMFEHYTEEQDITHYIYGTPRGLTVPASTLHHFFLYKGVWCVTKPCEWKVLWSLSGIDNTRGSPTWIFFSQVNGYTATFLYLQKSTKPSENYRNILTHRCDYFGLSNSHLCDVDNIIRKLCLWDNVKEIHADTSITFLTNIHTNVTIVQDSKFSTLKKVLYF